MKPWNATHVQTLTTGGVLRFRCLIRTNGSYRNSLSAHEHLPFIVPWHVFTMICFEIFESVNSVILFRPSRGKCFHWSHRSGLWLERATEMPTTSNSSTKAEVGKNLFFGLTGWRLMYVHFFNHTRITKLGKPSSMSKNNWNIETDLRDRGQLFWSSTLF